MKQQRSIRISDENDENMIVKFKCDHALTFALNYHFFMASVSESHIVSTWHISQFLNF